MINGKTLEKRVDSNKIFCIVLAFVLTLIFRFCVRLATYADLEAWFKAGEIVTSGGNIYAETGAYNYGFIYSLICGVIYKLASLFSDSFAFFRSSVIIMLTLADLFIALVIAKKVGTLWGMIFLLNPQSVWASCRNYQFDSIAVLLGFLGALCIEHSADDERITRKDIAGTLLLSLSLIMKHILWMFPVWVLLNTKTNTRKKILYAFVPPLLFLMSFVPYLPEGLNGIVRNVFMYRSANNFPLFAVGLLNSNGIFLPYQRTLCLALFGLLMITGAYVFRREKIFNLFMLYLIAQVCFSSGVMSYYFAIPAAALIILFREWSLIYFAVGVISRLSVSSLIASGMNGLYARVGMFIPMSWCLLAYLIYYYFRLRRKD